MSKIKNSALAILCALIASSCWIIVKLQAENFAVLIVIFYRFLIASLVLMLCIIATKKNFLVDSKYHRSFLLQGVFIFSINYILIYYSTIYLVSGIVALVVSSIMLFDVLIKKFFYKLNIEKNTLYACMFGILGLMVIILSDAFNLNVDSPKTIAFFCLIGGVFLTTFGYIFAADNNTDVLVSAFYSIMYGTLVNFVIILFVRENFLLPSNAYLLFSIFYLGIVGSAVLFVLYFNLQKNIGSTSASYVWIIVPVIALIISSFLEDFSWNIYKITGILMIVLGNFFTINSKNNKAL